MSLVKVIETSQIVPGTMKSVKVSGKELLVANIEGSFYVLDNKCPHAHAPLSKGRLSGCVLTCPLHHAQFNVKDGKNIGDAKILFLKLKTKDAHCYQVKIKDCCVMVEIA